MITYELWGSTLGGALVAIRRESGTITGYHTDTPYIRMFAKRLGDINYKHADAKNIRGFMSLVETGELARIR